MGKRSSNSRWTSTDDKRMRQWRSCGLVALFAVLILTGVFAALKYFRDGDHAHKPAPHGGVIVSLERGGDHYHVEAVVENNGTLKLYMFAEVDSSLEVESQVLMAEVKHEAGGDFTSVDLMPLPQTSEPEGKTTRFFAKLPPELRGKPLSVRINNIQIAAKQFALNFVIPIPTHDNDIQLARSEDKLHLTPGGRYFEADIAANGKQTALTKYRGYLAQHNMLASHGERICPVTRIKSSRQFTWVVSGKTYEFCCPPCIDEFVRRAKDNPETIKEPEMYVKK